MAAISEKYKNILVGRILKKVQDGVEMNGVVSAAGLVVGSSTAVSG